MKEKPIKTEYCRLRLGVDRKGSTKRKTGFQHVFSTLGTIFLSIKGFEKEILKEPLSAAKPCFFSDPLPLSRHRWTRRLNARM